MRQRLLVPDPLFVARHRALAAAAALGLVVAVASVHPWGEQVSALDAANRRVGRLRFGRRACPAGVVDTVTLLLGLRPEELTVMDRFSLLLYEPYWLLGGLLHGVAAWGSSAGRGVRSATL